jgi:NADH-quinone oxidoreductase subunit N
VNLAHALAQSLPLLFPVLGFLAILLLETIAPGRGGRAPALLAALSIALALARLAVAGPGGEPFGLLADDALARALSALLLLVAFAAVAMAEPLLERLDLPRGEFHALLLASLSGMLVVAGARDLLVFFLGIELLSIPLYALAGFRRLTRPGVEAGFKYFLLGAFASGFLLYGIALLYAACGDTHYRALEQLSARPELHGFAWRAGLALFLVGVGFKAAAAPFHAWVPDVYQGAATPVTAFMAAGVKTAAFGGALRLALEVLPDSAPLRSGLVTIACLSMAVGNLGALLQTDLKRMLAWSSIAHAGYLLVGIAAALLERGGGGRDAVLFYLATYAVTTLAAFALVLHLAREIGPAQDLRALRGLARSRPLASFALALCFLSLAGVPLTAGFFGKLYLIRAAWDCGPALVVPALLLAVTSVIGLGYYLRVVAALYMEPETGEPLPVLRSRALAVVTAAASAAVLLFGVWPSPLLHWLAP